MSAFTVISTKPNSVLDDAVQKIYVNAHYRVADNVWLVADGRVTTQEVSDRLGIDGVQLTNIVVIKVDSYWGRASKAMWEWLAVKASDP